MTEKSWLDYVTAVGSVATPILVLTLSALGWRLRTRLERLHTLEDQLREDRLQTYNRILKPFSILFSTDAAWAADPQNKHKDKNAVALRDMLSVEYREQAFKMSLVGSDEVVRAFNEVMQYSYSHNPEVEGHPPAEPQEIMANLGRFLLAIRKSMGNQATELDHWDMLEWFVVDARKHREAKGRRTRR